MLEQSDGNRFMRKVPCLVCICMVAIVLLILVTGCSRRPRDQYASDLISAVDKIYTNLEQYRTNPTGLGKPIEPVDMKINGKSVSLSGTEAVLTAPSYAEIVGVSAKDLESILQTVNIQVLMYITDNKGYEAWATATSKTLREKADKCLNILAQIKLEYKKNPDAAAYKSFFISNPYKVIQVTPEDELVFAVNFRGDGIMIERILRQDFRAALDAIHNYGKTEKK